MQPILQKIQNMFAYLTIAFIIVACYCFSWFVVYASPKTFKDPQLKYVFDEFVPVIIDIMILFTIFRTHRASFTTIARTSLP
jgi:hypothetical protein